MKKFLMILMALVMCLTLCACGDEAAAPAETAAPEQNEAPDGAQFIGTWDWKDFDEQGPSNGVTHLELYEGGTGKGTNSSMNEGSYYPVTWEVNSDVINITASDTPTVGMKLQDGKLVAVDGTFSYTKAE